MTIAPDAASVGDSARRREECWLETAGLRLHYASWPGTADSPLLILVHGGRDHCGTWEEVIRRLPAEWPVIAPDLRGHGDSAWAPGSSYSLWDYVTDLDALVRSVSPGRPVVLVGHSLGGATVLQYAGARPMNVAAVAVIEPFGTGRGLEGETALHGGISQDVIKVSPTERRIPAGDRLDAYFDALAAIEARPMPSYASLEEALARMRSANPRVDPEVSDRIGRGAVRQQADGTYAWKFDNRVRLHSPFGFDLEDASDLWRRITAPVLIVNGADSRPDRPPQSAGFEPFLADLTIATIAGASHFVQIEQPAAFAERVTAFLRDRIGTGK